MMSFLSREVMSLHCYCQVSLEIFMVSNASYYLIPESLTSHLDPGLNRFFRNKIPEHNYSGRDLTLWFQTGSLNNPKLEILDL